MKHIIFIPVDDLRPEIGCFGKKKLHTPNLDRLAERGLIFDRAYCQFPQCMPSRASVMTGIRPDRFCDRAEQLAVHGEPTLPGHFRANGYDTVSIGKVYHKNFDDRESWTRLHDFTFEEFEVSGINGYCSGYQLPENRRKLANYRDGIHGKVPYHEVPRMCETADAPDEAYPDARIADTAADVIREYAVNGRPLFLAAGFYRPHLPWAVPKPYWDLYDRNEVDLADNPFLPEAAVGLTDLCDFMHYGEKAIHETYSDLGRYSESDFPVLPEETQRECIHGYWASVSFMDAQIGKILDALNETGIAESCTVLLWGDNGWHLGEHALWSKTTHFEESTRVPVMISAPGVTARDAEGKTISALTELLDIYPTLCDLADIEKPPHLNGVSLLPLLEDPTGPGKDSIQSINHNGRTLRTDRFRITWYPDAGDLTDKWHLSGHGQFELFDLEKDPGENQNVASDPAYTPLLEDLKQRLVLETRH